MNFKSVVSLFTVFILFFGTVASGESLPKAPAEFPLASDENLEAAENSVPQVAQLAQQWADQQEGVAQELLELRAGVLETLAQIESGKTETDVNKLIDEGQVTFVQAGLGKAEVTRIDGHRIVKVVPHQVRSSYLFLNKADVQPLSAHLRQLIARTHLESDPNGLVFDSRGEPVFNKWTGQQKTATGRDAIVVWLDEQGSVAETQASSKATPASPRWWADYFYAKYKKVSADEVSFGVASGALQGAATALVVALKAHVDHSAMDWSPVIASFAFGSTVNSFLSTYRNWAYIGPSRALNAVKASTVSIGFNVSMVEAHKGMLEGLHTMNFATLHGISFDARMLQSAFVNNFTKNGWFKATAIRTKARQNLGSVRFSVFGKDVKWNKANIENAFVYLIPFTLKQLDLFFFLNIPVMQTLGWPVGEYLGLWYAKQLAKRPVSEAWLPQASTHANEYAAELQTEWNQTFGRDMPRAAAQWVIQTWNTASIAGQRLYENLWDGAVEVNARISERCSTLFQ